MKITFLGTGTSTGVPTVGCECGVCTSTDPRDKRLRASVLLEYGDRRVVIDTSTDFRQQALRAGLTGLDAVLFTHAHADHIFGLDDVRPFNFRSGLAMPCYADASTWEGLQRVFAYAFQPGGALGVPRLERHVVEGPFDLFGMKFVPVPVVHGGMMVLGYRFGVAAYVTDCNEIPDPSLELLAGLDLLILDGLRFRDHPTHMSIPKALGYVERLRPARTYLTHMNHEVGHAATSQALPAGVALAWDGLALEVGEC
jgi:phosphoribosyl 1,2-cyclic phosphate phosphodiesterase